MNGRAAIFTDVGKPLEFRDYPLPEVEPGAMLVKISMANICGSDLHFLKGQGPGVPRGIPQILGHEMTGHVARLGREVKTDSLGQPLREGDRVVYAYFRGCGTCWMCLEGQPGCPNRYAHWIGVSSDNPPHFNGAYAEYYYLRPGQWVFKVPDELPDTLVSPVNCALAEVIYGLHRTGITLGDSVVIQGAGGLGLYATAVAREMGAGQIIVLDRVKDRLDLAKAFGADHVFNVDEIDCPHDWRRSVRSRPDAAPMWWRSSSGPPAWCRKGSRCCVTAAATCGLATSTSASKARSIPVKSCAAHAPFSAWWSTRLGSSPVPYSFCSAPARSIHTSASSPIRSLWSASTRPSSKRISAGSCGCH